MFVVGGGNGVECFSEVEMFDPNIGKWMPIQSYCIRYILMIACVYIKLLDSCIDDIYDDFGMPTSWRPINHEVVSYTLWKDVKFFVAQLKLELYVLPS